MERIIKQSRTCAYCLKTRWWSQIDIAQHTLYAHGEIPKEIQEICDELFPGNSQVR